MHKVSNLSDLKELAIAEDFKNYAYIVSHDLGAPVRAMVEFSKLLKNECEGSLSEDGKEYLSFIVESGQNLQAMMNGLLSLSRISTVDTALSKIDIHEIVNEFCKSNNCSISCDALPQPVGEESLIKKLFLKFWIMLSSFIKIEKNLMLKLLLRTNSSFMSLLFMTMGLVLLPNFRRRYLSLSNDYILMMNILA